MLLAKNLKILWIILEGSWANWDRNFADVPRENQQSFSKDLGEKPGLEEGVRVGLASRGMHSWHWEFPFTAPDTLVPWLASLPNTISTGGKGYRNTSTSIHLGRFQRVPDSTRPFLVTSSRTGTNDSSQKVWRLFSNHAPNLKPSISIECFQRTGIPHLSLYLLHNNLVCLTEFSIRVKRNSPNNPGVFPGWPELILKKNSAPYYLRWNLMHCHRFLVHHEKN